MSDGQITFEDIERLYRSVIESREMPPPSSGLMTLGTARYIASRMGDDYQVHPGLKEVFANPEYSDSMVVEFVGEHFMVRK
jgi:hypothetical protein